MKNSPPKRTQGFSLIELTIVMTIAGLLIAAGVALYDVHQKQQRIEKTNTAIQDAQEALAHYARREGHWPCPAPLTAAPGTVEYATETDCSVAAAPGVIEVDGRSGIKVRIGSLPTRTLGISSQTMLDGWHQHLVYAVTKDLAISLDDFANDEGAITITDINDNVIAPGNAHYALVSAGPDGKGAYSIAGAPVAACSGSSKDNENCPNNATFRVDNESRAMAPGTGHFDDFAAYVTNIDITNYVPQGMIAIFPGPCPIGWQPYTPANGRFVVATGGGYSSGNTGGANSFRLSVGNIPDHKHSIGIHVDKYNGSGFMSAFHPGPPDRMDTGHQNCVGCKANPDPVDNRPAYIALNYCQKD